MEFIILIALVIAFILPFTRIIILNLHNSVIYGFSDVYKYFAYKKYNVPKTGELICFSAHFGGGKTLSMVDKACQLFRRYNNKTYYENGVKKTVKINVISNVALNIPYIELTSLRQIVTLFETYDYESNDVIYTYILIDEASVQLNSRNFKNNIDALFLNSLLTCRHYKSSLYYTSQKFKLTDALLRSVTQKVIQCKKIWRIVLLNEYDADTVENHSDLKEIKPNKRFGYFATDKTFNQYNTLACVKNLTLSSKNGDMLTQQEILANLGTNDTTNINIPKKIKIKK